MENAASWRWLFKTTAWPSGWTAPTYNDSTWGQGQAPLGFGAAVSTNIDVPAPTSNRPRSALFRRTFEIDDVNRYSGLQLTSRADDGVVLTVNGTEVNRTRLPTGTLSASSYATGVVSTATATANPVTVQVPKSLLRNGTNVLAAATVLNYKATPNANVRGAAHCSEDNSRRRRGLTSGDSRATGGLHDVRRGEPRLVAGPG